MATADSDLLIRAAASEGAPPAYDFSRPRAFSARQMGVAERVHADLAEAIAERLSALVGEPVAARCTAVAEVSVVDYERSRAHPSALFRLRAGGPHAIGVDLAPALALFMVERHFGSADPLGAESRALSALEARVVERQTLPALTAALATAWGAPEPRLDGHADRPDRLSIAAPALPALVVDLEVTVGPGTAALALCYPADAFRDLLAYAVVPTDADPGDDLGPAVDRLPVDVRAELGRTRLPVGDLLRLAPGDVIPLARAPEAPVPVWIGGRLRFEATPGTNGRRLALHLVSDAAPPTHDA